MGAFEDVVAALDQPMVVVTAASGDEVDGCLVGFHGQASIDPPRYVVMLSDKNRTTRLAGTASHLAVHAVGAGQLGLASTMGELTGDEVDKLARLPWHEGPHRAPILDDAPGWFVGAVVDRVPLGDHIAHVLEVVAAEAPPASFTPLRLHAAQRLDAGHDA
jgi:flavin reductase (DIM6/NTAB) family NADH-FMN oxidoreductase RutF